MKEYLLWVFLPNLDCFILAIALFILILGLAFLFGAADKCFDEIQITHEDKALGGFYGFYDKKRTIEKRTIDYLPFYFILAALFLFFVSTFIPTKEELITLKTIGIAKNIQGVKDLPENTVNLLNAFLKSAIKEVKQQD